MVTNKIWVNIMFGKIMEAKGFLATVSQGRHSSRSDSFVAFTLTLPSSKLHNKRVLNWLNFNHFYSNCRIIKIS